MGEPFELEWGEIKRSIRAVKERLENPKPVLREFSRRLTKDIKDNIASGGVGWPPKAASTLKREEGTGTSQVTRRGTIRSDRIKKTVRQMKRLEREVRDKGWSVESRKKYERLKKRLASFKRAESGAARRAERAAQAGQVVAELGGKSLGNIKELRKLERARKTLADASKDRLGKRVSEKRKLLQRMPGTIRNKLRGNVLVTYSKADEVGAAHNYGEGREPKREFLPPPNMEKNLDVLADLMESSLGQAWETGKGR
jgi:hypothetical protein